MGQHVVVLYADPRPVFIEVAFNGILKTLIIVTKFNIDITAGKGGVGGMRIGRAFKIAPGKFAGNAPGYQVVRLYNGNTQQ
jgi:hypothetical protein